MSLVLSSELTIPGQTLTPTQQNVENATRLDQQVVTNENKVGGGVRGLPHIPTNLLPSVILMTR